MTFAEFARLEPGTLLIHQGRPVIYIEPRRAHPMIQRLMSLTGIPREVFPPRSVIKRLRTAYLDVQVWDIWPEIPPDVTVPRPYRPMTEDEILAEESKDHPFAYFTAWVHDIEGGPGREVSPAELTLHGAPVEARA